MLFQKFPQLENDILYTKMIDHNDDDQFIKMMMNPNCFTYTRGYPKKTKKAAKQLIDRFEMDYYRRKYIYIGMYLKKDDKLIGTVKLFNIHEQKNSLELSYRFHESYWHHGYAEMSCRLVIHYLLHHIHVRHIYATSMKEDKVTNHILNRCGFVLIDTLEQVKAWPYKGKIDLMVYRLK